MGRILEFIIAFVFVIMVCSLVTSWVVEYLSMKWQRRNKMLKQFIIQSLHDPYNKDWGQLIYTHPLIDVLHRQMKLDSPLARFWGGTQLNSKRRLPMYIPAEQFATALIDLIINHEQSSIFVKDALTNKYVLKPQRITNRSYQDFLNAIDELKESETKITLASIVRHIPVGSGQEMEELRQQLALWYESGMERLTGWYKRETRKYLFVVGLLISVLANVHLVQISTYLWNEPTARAAVAAAATEYVKTNPNGPDTAGINSPAVLRSRIDSVQKSLAQVGLPIGHERKPMNEWWHYAINQFWGWLLMALAISFGAPFWFDVLKQFVNVRSAGLKPAGSR